MTAELGMIYDYDPIAYTEGARDGDRDYYSHCTEHIDNVPPEWAESRESYLAGYYDTLTLRKVEHLVDKWNVSIHEDQNRAIYLAQRAEGLNLIGCRALAVMLALYSDLTVAKEDKAYYIVKK